MLISPYASLRGIPITAISALSIVPIDRSLDGVNAKFPCRYLFKYNATILQLNTFLFGKCCLWSTALIPSMDVIRLSMEYTLTISDMVVTEEFKEALFATPSGVFLITNYLCFHGLNIVHVVLYKSRHWWAIWFKKSTAAVVRWNILFKLIVIFQELTTTPWNVHSVSSVLT